MAKDGIKEVVDKLCNQVVFYGILSLKVIALGFIILKEKAKQSLLIIKIKQITANVYPFLKEIDLILIQLLLTVKFIQNIFPFCLFFSSPSPSSYFFPIVAIKISQIKSNYVSQRVLIPAGKYEKKHLFKLLIEIR